MKRSAVVSLATLGLLGIASCQTSQLGPVPVTAAIVRAGASNHSDEHTLRDGRSLFMSRCIACHTLPDIPRYSATAWPHLVDKMAKRADLKLPERDAIVAYIVAVRQSEHR